MSLPVDFRSLPVDFVSVPVDFRSLCVDFRTVLSPSLVSMAIGANHHRSSSCGKITRNGSAICDQKVAFWDAKMPKKPVFEPPQL